MLTETSTNRPLVNMAYRKDGCYADEKVIMEEVLPWPQEHVTDAKRYHSYAPYAASALDYGGNPMRHHNGKFGERNV